MFMYKHLIRPFMFRLSADYAHELTINFGSAISRHKSITKLIGSFYDHSAPSLEQSFLGINFKNPIGLAAGFDKNGTMGPLMQSLGFGFIEVGSVTANPSTGNPKPRSFRLPADESIINRLGLNNDGVQTISKRLKKLELSIPLGINIAKTHDPAISGQKAIDDYVRSFRKVKEIGDFITINISCPNTTEGKTFEDPRSLENLLSALAIEKDSMLAPVLVKFSVDLSQTLLEELVSVCENHSISGYVACNTSQNRENLISPQSTIRDVGRGGLSGRAIRGRSTEIISKIRQLTKRNKLIIGVGGISSGEDAIEKLMAGADLLQIYTSLVYEGPSIVKKINKEIENHLKAKGLKHIYELSKG